MINICNKESMIFKSNEIRNKRYHYFEISGDGKITIWKLAYHCLEK